MQQMIFIADFIACSTCFGQYCAHHQELESIIQMVAACGIWCFGFQVVSMVWSWRLCVRFAGCMPVEHAINSAINIICCILLAFYFHIITTMHGQNHFKLKHFLAYLHSEKDIFSLF